MYYYDRLREIQEPNPIYGITVMKYLDLVTGYVEKSIQEVWYKY